MRGFGGIMQHLDRGRFEVLGLVSKSIVPFCRKQVASDDIAWIGFPHHLEQALKVFREAECDVVMHWHAGTDIVNYYLPFMPLAPVQCIGFGTHGTTGIANIDYFVSSRLFERGPEADDDYAESLVQFEGATAWQPRPITPEPASRSDFTLPERGTLYFCPQRQAKFHPDFDRLLLRILKADSDGHVVILAGDRTRPAEMLKARFAVTLGPTLSKRILFVSAQPPEGYYRLLSLMDVVLDAPAYSASLTGYDAFSLGVPLVTLPGRQMVQRYALGLYTRMVVEGLVASDESQYVNLAVNLAWEAEFRREMSGRILQCCDVLYEDVAVVREYESFFESAVAQTLS